MTFSCLIHSCNDDDDDDDVWVVIQTNIGELGVFSSYIRPTTGEGLGQLSQGLDMAIGHTRHRLVGMGSNGHSPLWGLKSVKQDQLGRRVEDTLAEGI